jgi:hypothetical protein
LRMQGALNIELKKTNGYKMTRDEDETEIGAAATRDDASFRCPWLG